MAVDIDLKALHSAKAEAEALINLLLSGIQQSLPHTSSRTQASSTSTSSTQSSDATSTQSTPPPAHNPLAILHTAATLLSSQATHLGLLSLTPPFTPTALTSTLRTIAKLLPAFATALQESAHEQIPECVLAVSRAHVRSLYEAVRAFVASVPVNAAAQDKLQADASEPGETRNAQRVLRGTGSVWEACKWFTRAGDRGVAPIALDRLREKEGLVSDAAKEIGEWIEEGDGSGADAGSDDDDDDFDEIFGAQSKCTASMQPLATQVVAHARLLRSLYPLLRTVAETYPSFNRHDRPEQLPDCRATRALNRAVQIGDVASYRTDEMAELLYSGTEDKARDALKRYKEDIAKRAADITETTEWLARWRDLPVT